MLNWFYTFDYVKNGEKGTITIPATSYALAEAKFHETFGDAEITHIEVEM